MDTSKRISFFLTLGLALLLRMGYGQPASVTLYSITEANGLSDNRVNCVFQDHRNFMWIGTEDGLNRYDGSTVSVFKRRKDSSDELAGDQILAIAEDAQHHLWIGTNHGLSEYDPETNSFRSWQCSLDRKDVNVMHGLWPDNHGNIWIASFGGLLQFIPSRNAFIPHIIPSATTADNRDMDILVDSKNRFWLTTYNGLWRFYPDKNTFDRITFGAKSHDLISAITESHDGRLWMGFWNGGLKWFNPETGVGKDFTDPDVPGNVAGVASLRNPQGSYDLWCGNLTKVDDQDRTTSYATKIDPTGAGNHVGKLVSSNDGLLWLCSDRGALIMDPLKQFFYHYHFPDQITHQGIAFQQTDRTIYVGGAGNNFLKLYDSSFHLIKSVSPKKNIFPGTAPALLSIVREDANHIWLCTEMGLMLLDEQTNEQQLFQIDARNTNVPTRNFISTIFIDSHHDHWVFPWRTGAWRFDPAEKKLKQIVRGLTVENGGLKGFLIVAVAEDSQGNLWLADLDEGLIYYDRSKGVFSKPADNYFHSHISLANVYYEKPYVWGATSGVVFRMHERTRVLESWTIPEEWNKTVSGFLSDKQNHLWIATRSGLLSFDRTSHQFMHFTTNDGLIDNMMSGSVFCLDNGKILYGDEKYFTLFNPKALVKQSAVPKVEITAALSQNQALRIQKNDAGEKYIELDYTFNNFTFDWAVLNYSNPLQNRYYCKLEKVDADWRYVGSTGRVQYASLSPGHYVFRARGATSDGLMNEKGDEISIVIHPPFWKSWWFFFTCGLTFFGLTYGWYRYRLNDALKTEKLRNKISTDLHDEIGSTLSSISIMSDLVVHKTNEPRTSEVANEIKENAIMLMERMDDIVWSINPRNDSLENLLLRVKRFAAQLFEARNIDYEINISPDVEQVKLPMEFRQNIYLILKEGINNVVKHSRCTRAVIDVNQEQDLLKVTITDNGVGFNAAETHLGNGIASMKNRAAEMKVKFRIESEKEKGTVVGLSLKIK